MFSYIFNISASCPYCVTLTQCTLCKLCECARLEHLTPTRPPLSLRYDTVHVMSGQSHSQRFKAPMWHSCGRVLEPLVEEEEGLLLEHLCLVDA